MISVMNKELIKGVPCSTIIYLFVDNENLYLKHCKKIVTTEVMTASVYF